MEIVDDKLKFTDMLELEQYVTDTIIGPPVLHQLIMTYIKLERYGEVSISYRCSNNIPYHDISISAFSIDFIWYKWRRAVWVFLKPYPCDSAILVPDIRIYAFGIQLPRCDYIINEIFPERMVRLNSIRRRRKLKHEHIMVPDGKIDDICDQWDHIALVSVNYNYYLCSPLGYYKVPCSVHTVYQALKHLKIKIPRDPSQRTWDNMQYYWTMALLAQL